MLPLLYPTPKLLDGGKLLRCQCPKRRLVPSIALLLRLEFQRVSAAVEVVPMCQDDISTFMDVSDDVGILRSLVKVNKVQKFNKPVR